MFCVLLDVGTDASAAVVPRVDMLLDFMSAPERLEIALASTSASISGAGFIPLGFDGGQSTPKQFQIFTGMPFPSGFPAKIDK